MAGLPKHFGQVGRRCVGGETEGLHIIEPRVPKTRAGVVAPKIRDRGISRARRNWAVRKMSAKGSAVVAGVGRSNTSVWSRHFSGVVM